MSIRIRHSNTVAGLRVGNGIVARRNWPYVRVLEARKRATFLIERAGEPVLADTIRDLLTGTPPVTGHDGYVRTEVGFVVVASYIRAATDEEPREQRLLFQIVLRGRLWTMHQVRRSSRIIETDVGMARVANAWALHIAAHGEPDYARFPPTSEER